jgi:hypothetical protein
MTVGAVAVFGSQKKPGNTDASQTRHPPSSAPSDGQPKGEENMKRLTTMLSAFALVLALALPSWAQVRELPKQTVTVTGTVETIDKSRRAVNIKTADGKFVALDVPASAKRFDELKVGDKVGVSYNNNVMVRLKPAGEAAVDTADTSSTMGKEARPGGTASTVRTMTATIADIDKGTSSMTFVGPNGWKYSRRVVDPKVFDQVKVGDKVDITWSTEVNFAVQ